MTTTTVACPHCHKELFRTGLLAPDFPVLERGPEPEEDDKGHFMTCGVSGQRVDLDLDSVPGSGARLAVRR